MSQNQYRQWLKHELVDSKVLLEHELGKPVRAIAYPFGGYDEFILDQTRQAGYAAAFTCDEGNISRITDHLRFNRHLVYRQTRWKSFVNFIRSQPLTVDQLKPRDGQRIHANGVEIQGRIPNMHNLQADSLRIQVDKLGGRWLPLNVNPQDGTFHFPLHRPLRPGYYFVGLRAASRQGTDTPFQTTWLFIVRKKRI